MRKFSNDKNTINSLVAGRLKARRLMLGLSEEEIRQDLSICLKDKTFKTEVTCAGETYLTATEEELELIKAFRKIADPEIKICLKNLTELIAAIGTEVGK
jgi:hypothetical protein